MINNGREGKQTRCYCLDGARVHVDGDKSNSAVLTCLFTWTQNNSRKEDYFALFSGSVNATCKQQITKQVNKKAALE